MDMEFRDKLKKRSVKRLFKSFRYALEGIRYAFRYEQNILVHFMATILVIIAGIWLDISYIEWLICFILIGLVIATELINTSIEAVVDLASPELNPVAKVAKDTASGAVLVFASVAVISGIIIFVPKFLELFM